MTKPERPHTPRRMPCGPVRNVRVDLAPPPLVFLRDLIMLSMIRMRGATAAAVWAAGDRPRGTVGEVWVGTKYNRPHPTTARRRAPALSLRAAPRTSVGDVSTA